MRSAGLDAATIERWIAAVAAERERRSPPAGFPELPLLPAARYSDPRFFALEFEALCQRGWVYAAHADQLPDPGSYVVTRNTGVPVLIIRGEDRIIRAFYNTCRHRGAPVVRDDQGRASNSLTCAYHGWTYRLDGGFRSVTDARDFANLKPDCLGLVPVRCESFGSFLFICEDPQAEPLAQFLEPIARFWRHLPLHELRPVHQHSVEIAGNYKAVLEHWLDD